MKTISWSVLFSILLLFAAPASAQESGNEEKPEKAAVAKDNSYVAQGRYLMKAGRFLEASKAFRQAVLEDRNDPKRFMLFASSLFAIGDYQYASHTIRYAAKKSIAGAPFRPSVAPAFSSKIAYMRKLDDLKRYITYNRRDPSALTVLAYTYFADNDDKMASRILVYLELLDDDDFFVSFLNKQIDARATGKAPEAEFPADKPETTAKKAASSSSKPKETVSSAELSLDETPSLPSKAIIVPGKRQAVLSD